MEPAPTITLLGDSALQVTLGPDRTRVDRALATLAALHAPEVRDIVAGHTTVVLHLDPRRLPGDPAAFDLPQRVAAALQSMATQVPATPRRVEIAVCYDEGVAPDLPEVAQRCGLTIDEVIARHLAPTYTVELVGFLPGFGYLTGLDPRLVLPRRDTPRTQVPAGSVAIAAQYTGVYPSASPGGWHLIGRTTMPLLQLGDAARPTLLARGDQVTFRRVPA